RDGVDIADVVDTHLLATERAGAIGFGRYIISARAPFSENQLQALRDDAAAVVQRPFSGCSELYAFPGWGLFPSIDRVYVNRLAMNDPGWLPRYDFRHVLDSLRRGEDFRSPLAIEVGRKGYHDQVFEGGPYPVT